MHSMKGLLLLVLGWLSTIISAIRKVFWIVIPADACATLFVYTLFYCIIFGILTMIKEYGISHIASFFCGALVGFVTGAVMSGAI
jgi:hypothetical protein